MYTLNSEKMFYDVADGVAVIIDFTSGTYYGLGELSSAVFENMMNGAGDGAILAALKAIPGCPDTIEEGYKAFLDTLFEREMILGDGEGGECAPIDPALAEGGFELTCEDFSEVQDLLLADPVHDVEPEMGWPFLKEEE